MNGGGRPDLPGAGSERLRLLLGAFGDPGHVFPLLALGGRLAERGHDVTLQTWEGWQEVTEAQGMRFARAPEYHVFPTRERPLKPFEAVVRAAGDTLPLVRELRPHAVVSDILTLAPALAGELEGIPARRSSPMCSRWAHRGSRRTRWVPGCRARRSAARGGAAGTGSWTKAWRSAGAS